MGPDTWGGLVTLERGRHATLKHQNSSEVPVLGTKLPSLSSGQPASGPMRSRVTSQHVCAGSVVPAEERASQGSRRTVSPSTGSRFPR